MGCFCGAFEEGGGLRWGRECSSEEEGFERRDVSQDDVCTSSECEVDTR